MTNAKLPDALRLSCWKDARSSRPDKAFTPHPAWKTRTLLSIWGQQMLA
ncbi:hypothetical protein OIU89_22400 [Escherichia coli]|nr:hypothetical protein [Escherichia coli]